MVIQKAEYCPSCYGVYVDGKDIRTGNILFDKCKFISKDEHTKLSRRCDPEKDDVLFSKSGNIGQTCVVQTTRPFSLFESVALIKPLKFFLNSSYLS